MSTVQAVIDLGYAKSAAARVESFAAEQELLDRIGLCLREVFQLFARETPYIIGVTQQVDSNGGIWLRPVNALRVIDVRADSGTVATPAIPAGARITVVPWSDQRAARGVPCLTELGQQFTGTGQPIDPTDGTVTMTICRAPVLPSDPAQVLDPLFPEAFVDLLAADIALYLATKEAREQDMMVFAQQKNGNVAQMLDWARAQTLTLVQRHPTYTPPLANTDGGRQQPLLGR